MTRNQNRKSRHNIKGRHKYKMAVFAGILTAVLVVTALMTAFLATALALEPETEAPEAFTPKQIVETAGLPQEPAPPRSGGDLLSASAILISLNDRSVLLDKNSGEKVYPASLTKMMTALVALERLDNPDEEVLLTKKVLAYAQQNGASVAGFLPGERVAAKDLLYGTMLPSGAECALGLALYISGSEKQFVSLMNDKAAELGMRDTHFTNVTGLHNDDHYSTAADLAVLLAGALENDAFREIFETRRYTTSPTNLHPEGFTFHSTLSRKLETSAFDGGEILGGKTGYTEEAGLCLASLAEKNGEDFILVTTGAPGGLYTEQTNVTDALTAYTDYIPAP